MKKYITTLIFISFLGLAVFGTMALNHRMDNSVDNCIGSQVNNTACPTNLVTATFHHISVYQALFNAFISPTINSLLLLSLLVFALVSVFLFNKNNNLKLKFLYKKSRDFELIIYKARRKFILWLSLFENSPSIT